MTQETEALPNSPKVALLAGKGDVSGLPRYIELLSGALEKMARITVVSDTNTGGFNFVHKSNYRYVEIKGLRTSLRPMLVFQAWRKLSALLEKHSFHMVSAHARTPALLLRLFIIKRKILRRKLPIIVITYHGLPFSVGQRQSIRALSLALEWSCPACVPVSQLI